MESAPAEPVERSLVESPPVEETPVNAAPADLNSPPVEPVSLKATPAEATSDEATLGGVMSLAAPVAATARRVVVEAKMAAENTVIWERIEVVARLMETSVLTTAREVATTTGVEVTVQVQLRTEGTIRFGP